MPSTEQIRQVVLAELRRLGIGTRRGPIVSVEGQGDQRQYANVQGYQGSATDENLRAAILEPYGHATHPPEDIGALLVRHGGQWVAIAMDDRAHRPRLKPGEVALYDQFGNLIQLCEDSTIELQRGKDPVAAEGDTVTITFSLTDGDGDPVTGTIEGEIAPTGRSVKV